MYVRTRLIAPNMFEESELDIKDLRNLVGSINPTFIDTSEKCFLNPHFGAGSSLVGGADADVIFGNTLIDVKVTKNLKVEREHFNQIIGYYFLSMIGGINSEFPSGIIKYIGIYFARHGLLWKVPVSSLGDYDKLEEFKEWLIAYFSELKENRKQLRKKK